MKKLLIEKDTKEIVFDPANLIVPDNQSVSIEVRKIGEKVSSVEEVEISDEDYAKFKLRDKVINGKLIPRKGV